jgi:PAS domain S-box-containing protein
MAIEADLIKSFVDGCDALIYLKDEQGRIIMANRQAAEHSKLSKEEFIGKTVYDILPKAEADEIAAVDRKVAATGAPATFTGTLSLRSGRVTVIDHKFPMAVEGHPHAVGGIAIESTALDAQKSLSRRALEMWSSDNPDAPEQLYTSTYRNHQEEDVAGTTSTKDFNAWHELVRHFRAAFPKAKVRIMMQIAEGDRVATHWELSATQAGEFMGFPATKRRATWTGVSIDRFEDGKIAETWVAWAKYRFLEQLGLLRQPEAAVAGAAGKP